GCFLANCPSLAVWGTELSLWEDAVQKGPAAHRARVNLAIAYNSAGRRQEALQQLQSGVESRFRRFVGLARD
ncbi:MAG TPA: tetratricopeptide repeat protein, partial [Candidatus Latescibacteria bacterium]|nr:tetratricopeptide repeat protein [Candidatus Latescibacterota bacterium]